jgi:hypothetical protein
LELKAANIVALVSIWSKLVWDVILNIRTTNNHWFRWLTDLNYISKIIRIGKNMNTLLPLKIVISWFGDCVKK